MTGNLNANITAVIASNNDLTTEGLKRADALNIPSFVRSRSNFRTNFAYSNKLFQLADLAEAQLVCFCGFLPQLTIPKEFIGKVYNIHPSLLPAFGGKGMYGDRVHKAVLESGATVSGCTVHEVNDELDAGKIVLQRTCPVFPDDTVASLRDRVWGEECLAYPEAIKLFAEKLINKE